MTRTSWRWRSRQQHLRFIAAGDQLPDWLPDWFLNRWPDRLLQRLLCRVYGHVEDNEGGVTFCIWCHWTDQEPGA